MQSTNDPQKYFFLAEDKNANNTHSTQSRQHSQDWQQKRNDILE